VTQTTRSAREHSYRITVQWTGNAGTGTSAYRDYRRDHEIASAGKPTILGSSDPHFRGDPARWNPEELLVAAISTCHQLWYLHLCSAARVVVTAYEDHAEGVMLEQPDGSGRFVRVVLHPRVTISPQSDCDRAIALHREAHAMCFVANSVNFPIEHEPTVIREGAD
jgi:organic hydroperoxide reductase OsmC/OhrA